jgi:heat shock protein beta
MSAEARVRILICDSNSDFMDLKRKTKKVVTNALVLQADDKFEYAEAGRIQNLVKNYSQFISFPIYTWQEKSRTKEVQLSSLS